MSMPLSPRSPASVNRIPAFLGDQLSKNQSQEFSPTRENAKNEQTPSVAPQLSSSPFRTDVTENIAFDKPNPVPQKEVAATNNGFEIYDEGNAIDLKASTDSSISKQRCSLPAHSRQVIPERAVGDATLSRMREDIFKSQTSSSTAENGLKPDTSAINDENEHDAPSMVSDDTCFSNFSAIPNADMTMFANLAIRPGDSAVSSPSRRADPGQTPNRSSFFTPGTSRRNGDPSAYQYRSPSPTPRQSKRKPVEGDTTNLLLDFTQTFDSSLKTPQQSPVRQRLSPTKTEPNLLSHLNNQRMPSPAKGSAATPGGKRNVLNLLDFDLPPQPTPRSVPTITVREMESLKSSYLSEISSLKANLSGKEAEVESLKKAVADAERRVGEALETVREERNAKEYAEKGKTEWEKKGQEIECVLQNVREEFTYAEKEKEELIQKLEEGNRLREEAELRAEELATKANVAQSEVGIPNEEGEKQGIGAATEAIVAQRVAQQLDDKMENLARELHTVYKKKHESKVATLKKTYELRSEKKCNELQAKIDELSKQNDDLLASKDATFSGELPPSLAASTGESEDTKQLETQTAELHEQRAKLAGLEEELSSVRSSHEQLVQALERERVEKGELVAAVDEMLALQSEIGAPSAVEDFRKSIGRPPASSGVKTGAVGKAPPSGLARPTSFGAKSKMMSNIERMGGARGPVG